jgi:hypothetical protein
VWCLFWLGCFGLPVCCRGRFGAATAARVLPLPVRLPLRPVPCRLLPVRLPLSLRLLPVGPCVSWFGLRLLRLRLRAVRLRLLLRLLPLRPVVRLRLRLRPLPLLRLRLLRLPLPLRLLLPVPLRRLRLLLCSRLSVSWFSPPVSVFCRAVSLFSFPLFFFAVRGLFSFFFGLFSFGVWFVFFRCFCAAVSRFLLCRSGVLPVLPAQVSGSLEREKAGGIAAAGLPVAGHLALIL